MTHPTTSVMGVAKVRFGLRQFHEMPEYAFNILSVELLDDSGKVLFQLDAFSTKDGPEIVRAQTVGAARATDPVSEEERL